MARTRHKRPKEVKSRSHARADWKHDDEVELLVCLEYVLSTHKDAGLFKTSLVKHLMNTRHAKYTVPQIERKMKKFWLANRHHAATDPEEIYRLGIKCLPRLSNDLKKEVGERFGTLKDQTLAERLATPRQLRSASRSADSELSRHISLGVEVAKTPSPRKRNREPFTSSARREGSRPRKRRDAESRVEQESNTGARQNQAKGEDEGEAMGPKFLLRVVKDSEDERSGSDDRDSPTIRVCTEHRSGPPIADCGPTQREEKMEHLEESRSTRKKLCVDLENLQRKPWLPQRSREKLQEEQNEQKEIINSLRHELSMAREDCKDLRRQLNLLDYAYPLLSQAENKAIIETLNANDKEMSELQEALDDKEWLRKFSTLSSDDPMPPNVEKVQAGMASIGDTIKRMLSECEDDGFCITPSFEWGSGLNSLFHRSFGVYPPEPRISVSQALDLSTFSFQAILRTLIAAALCEWVFESALPDISATPCALLKKYRLHLGKQDGEITLRNLDFAAHTSLIEEEFYQHHIIPARASVLADRILRTLAPLFTSSDGLQDGDGEAPTMWLAKKAPLTEVFENALRIKAQVTVSKDLFEMVLYSPETTFDQDFMVSETMDGGRAKIPSSSTSRVKLCLLPSLHLYKHNRKIVEYNNFIRRPYDRRSAAVRLTKAVVVLENAQAIS